MQVGLHSHHPLPHSQAFGVPGSDVAQSGAYSSILTDFCLEYTLRKHRRFIHICHSQPERGIGAGIVRYTGHQGLRVFRFEHNVGNRLGFKIESLWRREEEEKLTLE